MRLHTGFVALAAALVGCAPEIVSPDPAAVQEQATRVQTAVGTPAGDSAVLAWPAPGNTLAIAAAVDDALVRMLPGMPPARAADVRGSLETLRRALIAEDLAATDRAARALRNALASLDGDRADAADIAALALVLERTLAAVGDERAAETADIALAAASRRTDGTTSRSVDRN